jgi:hypothetical protein|eukprot:COSAG05_NODE_1559_length_4564_cov_2.602240_3_plen_141_part_00
MKYHLRAVPEQLGDYMDYNMSGSLGPQGKQGPLVISCQPTLTPLARLSALRQDIQIFDGGAILQVRVRPELWCAITVIIVNLKSPICPEMRAASGSCVLACPLERGVSWRRGARRPIPVLGLHAHAQGAAGFSILGVGPC